ncbi:MAG: glycosyltransferase family A protein [Patescibacteria group bacterium]
MISIFTLTLGRELYLEQQIKSILAFAGSFDFEHVICFQGTSPSGKLKAFFESLPPQYNLRVKAWEKNYGKGLAINKISPELQGKLILKLDDDMALRAPDFIPHLNTIHELLPNHVLSPFPVGLIANLGGPRSDQRFIRYSKITDTFYTLRTVDYVGGGARVTPAHIMRNFTWPDEQSPEVKIKNEDWHFSMYCRENNIPMAYLENALIVEHQESTLGQSCRYGQKYKGKFG